MDLVASTVHRDREVIDLQPREFLLLEFSSRPSADNKNPHPKGG
jgi:hypothetical protein